MPTPDADPADPTPSSPSPADPEICPAPNVSAERMMLANRANWDARTPVHLASEFYDLPGQRAGLHGLAEFEYAALGDLTGRTGVHLQCHLGTDTLALARAGARMTGVDLSGAAVTAARRLAADCGQRIDYHEANVYDAPAALGGRRFDVVYTGKGALCWLPDLDRWARVVADLLAPGGMLYLVEFHPVLGAAADDQPELDDGVLRLAGYDYHSPEPIRRWSDLTYTDGPPLPEAGPSYEWAHGLAAVVTALIRAGLTITALEEHDHGPFRPFPAMRPTGQPGWWRLPPAAGRIPLLYAVTAIAPR